jgi:NAD(P)-dependent dehydrogenase (short-subunit alcohol dehydrogenase family)
MIQKKPLPTQSGYASSKGALTVAARMLAKELGPYGIRVNSVHPYGTDTPMGNDVAMYQMFADHQTYIHSFSPGALPTDSLAAPDLVSDIVLWLAGDGASLVTAAQIPADKGYLKV